jgi:hypothetical protein
MKIPSKLDLIMWAAIALFAAGAIALVNSWRLDSGRLKVERTERKAELQAHAAKVSELEERIAIEIENRRKADEVSNAFQANLRELAAARADTPVRTVRMCNHGTSAPVPATAPGSAAGGHHAAGSAGLPQAPGLDFGDRWSDDGPDVGPALYALTDEADTCAATRDALQEWIRNR